MSEALNREYHELIGWKFVRRGDFPMDRDIGTDERGNTERYFPNLHLDANLCIAELDRVFRNDWIVDRTTHGFRLASCKSREDISESGATFNEAALKCLIAAHKRESEAV